MYAEAPGSIPTAAPPRTPAVPHPGVTLRGLRLAAQNMAKGALLLLALAGLLVVRIPVEPWIHAVTVAVLLVTIFAVARRGSDFRTWSAYVLGFVLWAHLRTLADGAGFPVRWEYAVDWERALFGGVLPTIWLQERFFTPGVVRPWDAAAGTVYVSYFIVPHVFAFVLWRARPALFRGYVAAALVAFYTGLVACLLVPTVPPWLAAESGHIPRVFTVISGVLRGWDAESYSYGLRVAATNPVAAMPSLHAGIACVFAIGMWRLHRAAGVLGWMYAAAMGATLVYGGEHYVVDVLAGAGVAIASWRVADRIARPRRRPSRRVRVPSEQEAAEEPVAVGTG